MKTVLLLFCLVFFAGCKKTIEQKVQNAIMDAMTNGQWAITSFTANDSDVTPRFAGYKFQYFSNYTVNAINHDTLESTGTWQGDVNAMNISADFPNAAVPLLLLNGTWHITDNSWTYVKASMATGTGVRTLILEKL